MKSSPANTGSCVESIPATNNSSVTTRLAGHITTVMVQQGVPFRERVCCSSLCSVLRVFCTALGVSGCWGVISTLARDTYGIAAQHALGNAQNASALLVLSYINGKELGLLLFLFLHCFY